MKWVALFIGSVAGGFSRYLLGGLIYRGLGASFPFGTVAVNWLGCFAIGFLNSWTYQKSLLPENARMLLMVGFCGAFTTFSTFILETATLWRSGESVRAIGNIVLSVVGGLLFFGIGERLSGR